MNDHENSKRAVESTLRGEIERFHAAMAAVKMGMTVTGTSTEEADAILGEVLTEQWQQLDESFAEEEPKLRAMAKERAAMFGLIFGGRE